MTKKILLIGAAWVAVATGPALAADMPLVPKTPPAAAVFDWTGFYAGAHAGYGWGNTKLSDIDGYQALGGLGVVTGWDFNGALGGVQAGYRRQADRLVYGVELDFAFSGMQRYLQGTDNPVHFFETDLRWFGTGRVNFGYAIDRGLIYLTGGFAYGDASHRFDDFGDSLFAMAKRVKWGWTVGAGWEYAFAPNWTVRGEYLYIDLADSRASFTDMGVPPATFRFAFDNRFHVARLALNYRFASGAPGATVANR